MTASFILIPVKPLSEGKSRLTGVISDEERQALSRSMLNHVLAVSVAVLGTANIVIVSGDEAVLEIGLAAGTNTGKETPDSGLNEALDQARDFAIDNGADSVLVLHADLPLLSEDDIRKMLAAAESAQIVIAPDQKFAGTNAMMLRPPDLLPFRFGQDSFEKHRAAAVSAGVEPVIMHSDGLSFDIDTPEDLTRWRAISGT